MNLRHLKRKHREQPEPEPVQLCTGQPGKPGRPLRPVSGRGRDGKRQEPLRAHSAGHPGLRANHRLRIRPSKLHMVRKGETGPDGSGLLHSGNTGSRGHDRAWN